MYLSVHQRTREESWLRRACTCRLPKLYERLPVWVAAPPASTLPLALEAAERARQLDPNLPEAYTALALIAANYSWDWATAE